MYKEKKNVFNIIDTYGAVFTCGIILIQFLFSADVMSTADTFSDDGVTSYSQLLFDIARKQVVVGARYVYRFTYSLNYNRYLCPYIKPEANNTRRYHICIL